MMRWLCVLLVLTGCAKKQQGISCANPDPATGACLRDESTVSDPNDTVAILEEAVKSNAEAKREIARLEALIVELEAKKEAGTISDSENNTLAQFVGTLARKKFAKQKAKVDTSKVPSVELNLKNKNHTGVRSIFTFSHVTDLGEIFEVKYEDSKSYVFNFGAERLTDKMVLSSVKIPIVLLFMFKGNKYCATTEVNSNFDKGTQPMAVEEC